MPAPAAPPPPALAIYALLLLSAMASAWTWALSRWWSGRPLLPDEPTPPPPPVPWGLGSMLAVFLLWAGLQVTVVALGGPILARMVGKPAATGDLGKIALNGVYDLLLLLTVPALLRWTSGAGPEHLGLGRGRPGRALAAGSVAGLLLTPVVYATNAAALAVWESQHHPMEMMLRARLTPGTALLAVVAAVVLAPAAEELIFRGVLMGWLMQSWSGGRPVPILVEPLPPPPGAEIPVLESVEASPGPERNPFAAPLGPLGPSPWEAPSRIGPRAWVVPNVLTSFLFAALHAPQWPAPIAIFVLSLGLGAVYRRTGSLLAPIALHALFNAVSTTALLVTAGHGPPRPLSPPPAGVVDSARIPQNSPCPIPVLRIRFSTSL